MSISKRPVPKIDLSGSGQHGSKVAIPTGHHLAITTNERIIALDRCGSTTLFTSKSQGILAARSCNHGSGQIAVADDAVLLLSDTEPERLQETRSWRLRGDKRRRRLLEFSGDGNILYFTTPLFNAIQCYNTKEQRLQESGPAHPSQPTVFALSSNGESILSASSEPSVVYLTNLKMRTSPIGLPTSSSTIVSAAAFHPERPNIFALALQDGSVAAYDATRIERRDVYGGKMAEFERLHIVTSASQAGELGDHLSVPAIAFLPGFKSRVASVSSDGRCHILDFNTGKILKSWHVRAPATSIAVLKNNKSASLTREAASKGTSTLQLKDIIIAIGRTDGRIVIHDGVGNLFKEIVVQSEGMSVLGVQWIESQRSTLVKSTIRIGSSENEAWVDVYGHDGKLRARTKTESITDPVGSLNGHDSPREIPAFSSTDDKPLHNAVENSSVARDPVGTVVKTKVDIATTPISPEPSSIAYMDLFSPVKPGPLAPVAQPPKKRSPTRARIRLSSSTFTDQAKKAKSDPSVQSLAACKHNAKAISKAHSDGPRDLLPADTLTTTALAQHESNEAAAYASRQPKLIPGAYLRAVSGPSNSMPTAEACKNSQIIHDIRRLTDPTNSRACRTSSQLDPVLAVYRPKDKRSNIHASRVRSDRDRCESADGRRTSSLMPAVPPATSLLPSVVSVGEGSSICTSSIHAVSACASQLIIDHDGGDLWFTDSSEGEADPLGRHLFRRSRIHQYHAHPTNSVMSGILSSAQTPRISDALSRQSTLQRIYHPYSLNDEELFAARPPSKFSAPHLQDHPLLRARSSPPFMAQCASAVSVEKEPPPTTNELHSAEEGIAAGSPETIYPTIDPSPTDSWKSVHLLSPQRKSAEGLVRTASVAHPPTIPLRPSSYKSHTYTSTTRGTAGSPAPKPVHDQISKETMEILPTSVSRRPSAAELLPPGFAESRLGPVEVQRWLPRQGSLAHALDATGLRYNMPRSGYVPPCGLINGKNGKIRSQASRRCSKVSFGTKSPQMTSRGSVTGSAKSRPAYKDDSLRKSDCRSCEQLLFENETLRAEVKRLQDMMYERVR